MNLESKLLPEDRSKLLAKPFWTYKDIKAYFSIGTTKACKIRKQVADAGGLAKFSIELVRTEAVFAYLDLNLNEEMERVELAARIAALTRGEMEIRRDA